MDIKFTINKDKIKEKNADGVNVMFNETRFSYCYGGAIGIISEFMLDFVGNADVETLVSSKETAKEMGKFIMEHRKNLEEQLYGIVKEKGYDLIPEIILEKTLENIELERTHYGMYITFETIVV